MLAIHPDHLHGLVWTMREAEEKFSPITVCFDRKDARERLQLNADCTGILSWRKHDSFGFVAHGLLYDSDKPSYLICCIRTATGWGYYAMTHAGQTRFGKFTMSVQQRPVDLPRHVPYQTAKVVSLASARWLR
jgi:hypothetical protein